jgi:4-hydroxythreonine-4-phosphate dehydrogenase
MGDAAGIGPEITLKAFADKNLQKICSPVVIGDVTYLRKTALDLGINFEFVETTENFPSNSNHIAVHDLHNLPDQITLGEDSGVTGKAAAEYIETAVRLWREKKIDAICTAPISKKRLRSAVTISGTHGISRTSDRHKRVCDEFFCR